MSIPGSASPLFFGAGAAEAAAAGPIKSVRFNSGDSAYLNRTPSSAGNRTTWTWAGWIKRNSTGNQRIFTAGANGTYDSMFQFVEQGSHSQFEVWNYQSGDKAKKRTKALFRDFSAWYHIVVSCTSSTLKIYVNGTEADYETGGSNVDPDGSDWSFNSTVSHTIGKTAWGSEYFNGYLADVYWIDGQAKDPTDFGAFDDNGVWQAAAYSGTFGTNGFHLFDFANESGIGNDSSGNDNDFTANNLNATDVIDPTAPGGSGVYSNNYFGFYLNGNPPLLMVYDPSGTNRGDQVSHGQNTGTTWAVNDVLQWAVDWDNQKIWIGRNNTWYSSGDPANGTNAAASNFPTSYNYFLALGYYSSNFELQVPSSASYTPPSGFSYWGGATLSTWKNSGTNQGGTPDIFKTPIPKSGKTYIEAIIKGGTNTYVTLGLCNFGETTIPTDVLFDVPTNGTQSDTGAGGEVSGNYPTWNPLDKGSGLTLSNGNLQIVSVTNDMVRSTIAMTSGKWYAEYTHGTGLGMIGIANADADNTLYLGQSAGGAGYYSAGTAYFNDNGGTSYGASYTTGDVIGVALDADTGGVTFYKNGVSQGALSYTGFSSGPYHFACGVDTMANSHMNFGQRAFAYSAPSGYKALCTTNLPTPTIADGSTAFDAALYTGNGSTQSITGLNFASSPDFVWIKQRNVARDNVLFDALRGANEVLYSNASTAEATYTNTLNSFDSSGFTLGGNQLTNESSGTYVAWAWDAGTSTASNTDGSITSSVRASQTNGFSIVTYTDPTSGSLQTVGHGLNAAPEFIIVKSRTGTTVWLTYHKSLGKDYYTRLDDTDASYNVSNIWGNAEPTSSVFGVKGDNQSNMVAYCFAPVTNYSQFGVYEGNGDADGPFVYTGFRPALIMVKRTDSTGNWIMIDSSRDKYNYSKSYLEANDNAAEGTFAGNGFSLLSNGFKLEQTTNSTNASSGDYIYMAWAENPFSSNGGLAR